MFGLISCASIERNLLKGLLGSALSRPLILERAVLIQSTIEPFSHSSDQVLQIRWQLGEYFFADVQYTACNVLNPSREWLWLLSWCPVFCPRAGYDAMMTFKEVLPRALFCSTPFPSWGLRVQVVLNCDIMSCPEVWNRKETGINLAAHSSTIARPHVGRQLKTWVHNYTWFCLALPLPKRWHQLGPFQLIDYY